MKLFIHDLPEDMAKTLFSHHSSDYKIISGCADITPCMGCFGCWIKSPAKCCIPDKYHNMGKFLASSEEFIIISRCIYGCYSPEVKVLLDRSISYLLPFFKVRNGMVHHKLRYKTSFSLTTYFYGEDLTPNEISTAKQLVQSNACNLNVSNYETIFLKNPLELGGEFR